MHVPSLKLSVFEFALISQKENPATLLIDEVKQGQSYELVLTTPGGLYRYRNGDVVEVVGFHEKCPVIQFKYRLVPKLSPQYKPGTTNIVNTRKWHSKTERYPFQPLSSLL